MNFKILKTFVSVFFLLSLSFLFSQNAFAQSVSGSGVSIGSATLNPSETQLSVTGSAIGAETVSDAQCPNGSNRPFAPITESPITSLQYYIDYLLIGTVSNLTQTVQGRGAVCSGPDPIRYQYTFSQTASTSSLSAGTHTVSVCPQGGDPIAGGNPEGPSCDTASFSKVGGGGTAINGVCAATHYNCSAGTSANNVNGASAWTWSCNGSNGGTNASCSEDKPSTPPANPPTGLFANPGACGTGTINVSWDPVSGATSYDLRDGASIIYSGAGTSFSHTGLVAGSFHSYSVRANNASGSSSYSGATSASAPLACPSNQPPVVDAGPDQAIAQPTSSTSMAGSASDPDGFISSHSWTKISGPSATIGTPSSYTSSVTGMSTVGTYVFRLTATDNQGLSAFDDMQVVVSSAAGQPDLTAAAPTPAAATINVPLTFSSTISNIGNASTTISFPNFFQKATAANGGGTITDLASSTMSALPAGGSNTSTSPSVTFTTTGTYSVRACADKSNSASSGVIPESDETNNCSPWTNVTVTSSSAPDLTAGNIPVVNPTVNVPVTFSSNISNIGTAGTGAGFNNLFEVATDSFGTGAALISVNALPALGANASSNLNSSPYTFPFAGTYYVRACADNNASFVGTIAESNEFNNCGAAWTAIVVGAAPMPDLTAAAPTPSAATTGVALTFSASISNIGTATTGTSFSNFFQRATAANGTGTITDLASSSMGALAAGGNNTSTSPSISFSPAGTYSVRACANKANSATALPPGTGSFTESNWGNNCSPWTNVVVTDASGVGGIAGKILKDDNANGAKDGSELWMREPGAPACANPAYASQSVTISYSGPKVSGNALLNLCGGTGDSKFDVSSLPADTYTVTANLPTGWQFTDGTNGQRTNVVVPAGGYAPILFYYMKPAAVATASLTVNPPSIYQGQSATLTWSSTNAPSCSGTNFNTGGAANNSSPGVTVTPLSTVTYTVTCGGVSDSKTLTVKKKPGFIEN